MTEVTVTARMPHAATSARFVITLQVAFAMVGFSLYGMAILTGGLFELAPILSFTIGVAFIVALGRLTGRWHSRLRRIRWATVALEIVIAGGLLVADAIDAGNSAGISVGGLVGSMACPAVVIVLMLVPATGRWFDR